MKLQLSNLFLISMVGFTVLFDQTTFARMNSIQEFKVLTELANSGSGTDYTQEDFFTISDFQENINKHINRFQNPINMGSDFFTKSVSEPVPPSANSQNELSLLNWLKQHEDSHSIDKYVRAKHFGSWIKDPSYGNCLNTRGQILIRNSMDPVEFDPANKCRVISGRWHDPYTDQDYTNADDLQIDHVVPLKNAYVNGAWGWSQQARCLYSNFLSNTFQLLPVFGNENSIKGDSTPDAYIPPNHEFTCKYIENWLKIKAIWKLRMSTKEAAGIKRIIEDNNCEKSDFFMSENDLQEQRKDQEIIPSSCLRRNTDINQNIHQYH